MFILETNRSSGQFPSAGAAALNFGFSFVSMIFLCFCQEPPPFIHCLMAQGQKEACSQALRIISCRLISCHRHVSHAQMHADFKDRNPGPYSGLVSFISGSGHVHILWTSRQPFRHGSRAGQEESTKDQREDQVNDEDDNHIIIRRGEEVQMELSSSGRSGHQYVCSRS